MDDAVRQATAAELGRGIAAGKIAPEDLTEAFLDAIGAHPRADEIYARLTPDRARAEAAAAGTRARAGTRRGPLDGVPISWKDLYDTAGVATESGSALLAGRVPSRDALVLQRASRAGLVCLGKTHQTELAFSGLGVNPVTATPPNGLDPAVAPGGSSSGAASSVTHGLAAAGIGSDTGGSVRIPAAWQDLVGLKTGHGVLPLDGVVPLCARFDTVGPLTRSVEDAHLLFATLDGRTSGPLPTPDLSDRRFLVITASALPVEDSEPQAAFESALSRLSAAGAKIDTQASVEVDAALPLSAVLFAAEAWATWGATIESAPEKMHGPVRERFRSGRDVSARDFIASWQTLDSLRKAFRGRVAGYDGVLLPSCPILPPPVDRLLADDGYFVDRNLFALRNTRVGNLMDFCALTLPTGTPHCGLMLLRPGGEEQRLLTLGAALEKSLRGA